MSSKESPPGATFASTVIEASAFLFLALSWSRELIREFQDPYHFSVSKDGLVYFSSLLKFLCVWVFYLHVCAPSAYLVPLEVRSGGQIP